MGRPSTQAKMSAFKRDKRLGLPQKAAPYMFERATRVANWIPGKDLRPWPKATDTINLSQFARKIFSAPSSSGGSEQTPERANLFGVLGVRYARSVTTNIPRCSIGYATIITISAP